MNWTQVVRDEFSRLGRRVDESVIEELSQHAAAAWQTARADGASPDAADASIRAMVVAWCASTNGPKRIVREPLLQSAPASTSMFAGLPLDIRHAFRVLRRHRGFALVSILMIALGIGATTSLFTVLNGVLLKPLPWKDPSRLVALVESREGAPAGRVPNAFTNGAVMAWLGAPSTTIESIGVWTSSTEEADWGAGPQKLQGTGVNPAFMPTLGVTPAMGRGFTDDDAKSDDAVILSHALWLDKFGGGPVIGKSITFDGTPRQVIGVMPATFAFPATTTQYWRAFHLVPAMERDPSGKNVRFSISIFSAIARLKPGVTPAMAAAEGQARLRASGGLGPAGPAVFGTDGPAIVTATPWLELMTKDVRPAIIVMFVAVVLLFIAAIGNVANMQLSHATARRREMAIRSAIGAGAGRLSRQLFVETLIVALAGGLIGLAFAAGLLRALPSLLPRDFPRPEDIALDARVVGAVTFLVAATAALIGLLPVRLARRVNLTEVINEDGTSPVGQSLKSSASRSRVLLVTAQVAISVVLLVGAALLSRSFFTLLNTDRGFVPSNLMTARVSLPREATPIVTAGAFFAQAAERLRSRSGVTSVAYTPSLPLTGSDSLIGFTMPGRDGKEVTVNGLVRVVSRDYFSALGMRVLRGRGFQASDTLTSEPVIVVNDTFVKSFLSNYPDGGLQASLPAGLHHSDQQQHWRVVGIVDDVHHRSATEPVQPEIFAVVDQLVAQGQQYLVARTTGDPSALAGDIRSIVRDLNPRADIDQVMTMDARLMSTLTKPRLYAVLLGGFAGFALVIAAIGLFGGLSYGVSQRTREIGVRSALGATPGDIIRLIVGQGIAMTTVGLVVGVGVAFAATRYLSTFLFGITAHDLVTFVGAGALLLVVALIACAIPAIRASRIDAIGAMRR